MIGIGPVPSGVCSLLIELSYDLALEVAFLVFGRYPIDLMNQIASKKLVIYDKLSDDLGRPCGGLRDRGGGEQDCDQERFHWEDSTAEGSRQRAASAQRGGKHSL